MALAPKNCICFMGVSRLDAHHLMVKESHETMAHRMRSSHPGENPYICL
jgi:hypothetical protein